AAATPEEPAPTMQTGSDRSTLNAPPSAGPSRSFALSSRQGLLGIGRDDRGDIRIATDPRCKGAARGELVRPAVGDPLQPLVRLPVDAADRTIASRADHRRFDLGRG